MRLRLEMVFPDEADDSLPVALRVMGKGIPLNKSVSFDFKGVFQGTGETHNMGFVDPKKDGTISGSFDLSGPFEKQLFRMLNMAEFDLSVDKPQLIKAEDGGNWVELRISLSPRSTAGWRQAA